MLKIIVKDGTPRLVDNFIPPCKSIQSHADLKFTFQEIVTFFNLMESFVQGPDLLIYLRSSISNLVDQIHRRGREYENSISIDYLSRLNERYEAWIHGYDKGKLLIIDVDDLNFVDNPEDLGSIINRIDAEINGLF